VIVAPEAVRARYRRIEVLGRGTEATVWRATDVDGRAVALKVYNATALAARAEQLGGGEQLGAVLARIDHADVARLVDHVAAVSARAEKIGAVLARTNHPNVVGLVDYGPGWLATELVEGETLGAWFADGTIEGARTIVAGILSAALALHGSGVLPDLLEPDNVIVRPDGTPVVVDFWVTAEKSRRADKLGHRGARPPASAIQGAAEHIPHAVLTEVARSRGPDALRRAEREAAELTAAWLAQLRAATPPGE
jgi:serine/threonine protein kinase